MERLAVSQRFDLSLAAGLAAIATVEAATTSAYAVPVELLLAPALAVPLVWRRTRPVVSLAGVLVVFALQRLVFGEIWDTGSAVAIPLVSAYSIAAYTPLRTAVGGLVALVGVIGAADLTSGGDSGDLGFILLIYGALWIAGLAVRRQRQLVDRVSMYVEELEQTQALREEAVAAEERVRIARELHDVVAHCVSTIVVQAEAGQSLIARDPVGAADAFSSIQQSGRQALDELRRMVGLLRGDQTDERAVRVPQPSLTNIEALLGPVRAAGVAVDLTVTGRQRALPQVVDLSAYRIVQEALTNVLKHARASSATVKLDYGEDDLSIRVTDDGRGHAPSNGNGPGHGLLGMRERARLHGGTLEAATVEGGFAVSSRLPLA